jgi:hypothetical protein
MAGVFDPTSGVYDPSIGRCQLARLTPQQLADGISNFRQFAEHLQLLPVPYVIKQSYSDMDVVCTNPKEKILSFLHTHYDPKSVTVNGSCVTIVWEGFQLDIISIFGLPAGELFYANNFGLLVHIMLDNTPFSLGANGLLLDKPSDLGGKFCVCQDPLKILDFMKIDRKVMIDNLTPDELFTLLTQSPFYQPEHVSVTHQKLGKRFIVDKFLSFCQSTPKSSSLPPSSDEVLAFFGKSEEFTTLIAQERRSKDAEARQAKVKKHLLVVIKNAAIKNTGFKEKDVKVQFDAFKAWIHHTFGMSYEDWAQTEPNVEEAFAEFGK